MKHGLDINRTSQNTDLRRTDALKVVNGVLKSRWHVVLVAAVVGSTNDFVRGAARRRRTIGKAPVGGVDQTVVGRRQHARRRVANRRVAQRECRVELFSDVAVLARSFELVDSLFEVFR